ncbi:MULTISPECIES: glycosyltransferase [Cyanophyceae]|uniref:Glycosyltransferase n=1 Tax=Leptolyngbya subtilissima DQ-A4 TaxID=2933933 RepID=A0ABV0K968_9CYAN|nr:glycosyltransferase [Nodosilinea sp. FACHB-141]MBD2114229.1 glycosyltransferase [Nodosilinea sp. FACHB-141]
MTKRIAIISEHASPLGSFGGTDSGGQNVYVGQTAKQLAALGYQVDVFTRRDDAALPELMLWHNGIRIIHVPAGPPEPVPKEDLLPHMGSFGRYVLAFARRQQRQNEGYHLIHANFWMSALVASQVKQHLGIPFVVTFHALGKVRRRHQGQADRFPNERFAVEEQVVEIADGIVAECPQDRDDLIQLYGAKADKIHIVPCGVDLSEFWPVPKAQARATLGLSMQERVVLQLGRMVPRKGVDTVIEAIAMLAQQNLPTRLVVVGGESPLPDPEKTPEIGRLQALTAKLGLQDRVTFVGQRQREVLKYFYSAADLFVTTPWYEPFGITPLEAMACGTPVIGSNVGGIKFTVRDGETGYLVSPKAAGELCDRIAFLYRHPDVLNLFGRQALRHVTRQFTWPKVASALASIYESVLAKTAAPDVSVDTTEADLAQMEARFDAAILALRQSRRLLSGDILAVSRRLSQCFSRGGKVLVCGNGGSAADAQHFAAELVGRFQCQQRAGLPVMALTADTALLTAWANDVGYNDIFARQVSTFAQPEDVLVVISTSGRSRNLIEAVAAAKARNVHCIGLLGGSGGDLLTLVDEAICVPSPDPQRIQEVQILTLHLICEWIEDDLQRSDRPVQRSLASVPPAKAIETPRPTASVSASQSG